ncbi:MAG: hypothetical protein HUJ25_14330 [Crocinitomicaceae bacterium]|nr:hypothetical protein [Crocinitomicaceae bacterium]
MSNLSFNILTFNHPEEKYTFYFTNKERSDLCRVFHTLVPDEVVQQFGEQEHYYVSFNSPLENGIEVVKDSSPTYETLTNDEGEEYRNKVEGTCFSTSVLKRYYNFQIQQYFKQQGVLVKPNFISDIEIWIPVNTSDSTYNFFEKFTLKVQFATVTRDLELLITYAGKSKIFKQSVAELMSEIPQTAFNWIVYDNELFKNDETPDHVRRDLSNAYPVWNFEIRDALNQTTPAPDRGNKYKKYKDNIEGFISEYLDNPEFKKVIPLNSTLLTKVDNKRIGQVSEKSNLLLFGEKRPHSVPRKGMEDHGPYGLPDRRNIHLFFIVHNSHTDKAKKLHEYFDKGLYGERYTFKGLQDFAKIEYHVIPNFSVVFSDLENPVDEIKRELEKRTFEDDVNYMAVYISPFDKEKSTRKQKGVYYKVKEHLLKKNITSQVIAANKFQENEYYVFSLNNIATAMLAKLEGEPWRLDRKLKNELIIGVGAFKHRDTDVQYIGSAFSFQNNGSFNHFECFRNHQTTELAGSILQAVKDFYSYNSGIKRLIIHFYKQISQEELQPIEDGLNELDLGDTPVFIVTINKTVSRDIVAFDNSWDDLMPLSGKFINIGWNRYLLFNNTRYSTQFYSNADGFPFPIKVKISCNDPEQTKDIKVVRELLDQIYQFSRMYWKSMRQQNLPVTIKYPEMVAEMFPHFDGNEIPDFGKDKLWFL